MRETAQSSVPDSFHRVLYGASELRSGWRLLIFIGIVAALLKGNEFAGRRLHLGGDDATAFVMFEVMGFLIFLVASWLMGRFEGRTLRDYGLPWRSMFRGRFWQGAALGFASITVLLCAMRAAGVFHYGGVALHGFDIWKWAAMYGLVFILVGLREEFRSRGYLLFTLSMGIGFWPAAVASSVLFGLGHHGNAGEDWIGLFNAGAFGLLCCLLLRRTGNLWLPIGLHTAFDWGETYFYGVADSGKVLPDHFLNSSSSGPGWLSGGSVGPEGSVFCTLLIALLWVLCSAWLREVKYPVLSTLRNAYARSWVRRVEPGLE